MSQFDERTNGKYYSATEIVESLSTGSATIEDESKTLNDSVHLINTAAPEESGIYRSYLEYTGESEEQIFGVSKPSGGLLLIREDEYDEFYLGHFRNEAEEFAEIQSTANFSTTDNTVNYYITVENGTLKLIYDGGVPRHFHASLIS